MRLHEKEGKWKDFGKPHFEIISLKILDIINGKNNIKAKTEDLQHSLTLKDQSQKGFKFYS
jgi:hypothetical protein